MKKTIVGLIVLFSFSIAASSDEKEAQKLLENRMRNPLFKTEGTLTGEGVCWHAAYDMERFMRRYRASLDTAFLDAGVRYYDALIEKMHESPDGYKGWVGPFIYDKDYICDVHIGDAILITPMLEFSEIVLKQSTPEIKKRYADKAKQYVALAKKHLIEKWDERGTWHEDGPYGAYSSWDKYMTPDDLTEWRVLPVTKSILSLPFNKQNEMALACLRIYRITGEERYRDRAAKIYNFMKSRMYVYDDCLLWNYWEPFGPWDIDDEKPNALRHWVNVHPYRNYQAGEIGQIVEAYHSGLTFTKEDIQRIINTNLKVMWNGDTENPKWGNSHHAAEIASMGKISITKAPGGHFPELAGTLWRSLADFDATVRELANIEPATPPSFERKHKDLPVTEFDVPISDNCHLNLATVIPSHIDANQTTRLLSQSRIAAPIEIALYSNDGKTKLQVIREKGDKGRVGLLIKDWKADSVQPGAYRIRWTIEDQYREFPIVVR